MQSPRPAWRGCRNTSSASMYVDLRQILHRSWHKLGSNTALVPVTTSLSGEFSVCLWNAAVVGWEGVRTRQWTHLFSLFHVQHFFLSCLQRYKLFCSWAFVLGAAQPWAGLACLFPSLLRFLCLPPSMTNAVCAASLVSVASPPCSAMDAGSLCADPPCAAKEQPAQRRAAWESVLTATERWLLRGIDAPDLEF